MKNPDLNSPHLYINRELSWLDFNFRVLEEAQDSSNPLLERVKFLAIVANNLDEFYEIRVAGLLQLLKSGANPSRPDRLSPQEQLVEIEIKTRKMVADQYNCWNDDLLPALREEGVYIWESKKLTESHVEYVTTYWYEQLEPVLTPIVVDPAHPFPSVINKALCIGTLLKSEENTLMGVSTVPRVLPRLVKLPDIDGTKNFIRGLPIFGSLFAIEDKGTVVAGMVSAPALKDRWWAEKGQGAFHNGSPINVSSIERLDEANGLHGSIFGSEACSNPEPVIKLLQDTYRQRGFGDFYPHMLVAMGCGEYAIDFKLNVWDIAPLKIIVEEAGGTCTDSNGNNTIYSGNIISSNSKLDPKVLSYIKGCE